MKMIGRTIGVAVLGIGLAVGPALAQQGGQGGQRGQSRGMGMRGSGPKVEQSISMMLAKQEELGLTQEQVAELEGIRAQFQEASAPLREEQEAFSQKRRAGDVTPNEAEAARADWSERSQAALAPFRERVHGVLTEQQQGQMQELMRSNSRRGESGRGARGQGSGQRGGQGDGAAMGNAYAEGYRAGMRQSRGMGGERSEARKGSQERRSRRGTAKPDSIGTGNPS